MSTSSCNESENIPATLFTFTLPSFQNFSKSNTTNVLVNSVNI